LPGESLALGFLALRVTAVVADHNGQRVENATPVSRVLVGSIAEQRTIAQIPVLLVRTIAVHLAFADILPAGALPGLAVVVDSARFPILAQPGLGRELAAHAGRADVVGTRVEIGALEDTQPGPALSPGARIAQGARIAIIARLVIVDMHTSARRVGIANIDGANVGVVAVLRYPEAETETAFVLYRALVTVGA